MKKKYVWVKSKLKKYYWIIFIIVVVETLVLSYIHFDRVSHILYKMFMNKDGFQWISITSIGAIIALAISWSSNNKNIKANIISGSIVKWLETARESSSGFVQSSIECMKYINTYSKKLVANADHLVTNEKIREEIFSYIEKAESHRSKATEKLFIFKMLFEDNDDNEDNDKILDEASIIMNNIDNIFQYVAKYQENKDYIKIYGNEFLKKINKEIVDVQEMLDKFVFSCRKYYKKEWGKAKRITGSVE